MNLLRKSLVLLVCFLLAQIVCGDFKTFAKSFRDPAPTGSSINDLSAEEIKTLIGKINKLIDEKFVDIPAGKKVIEGISRNLNEGKYKSISSEQQFIEVINKDLYALSKDLHLSVRPMSFVGQPQSNRAVRRGGSAGTPGRRMMRTPGSGGRLRRRPDGGHFVSKILEGNVGFVKINGVLAPLSGTSVKEDMENALKKVKDTDAVIFDLRSVPGGVPETMSLLSSYLYDEKPKLLNTYHNRLTGPNKLLTNPEKVPFHFGYKKPLYALINNRTASGGEAFTYVNQQHGRLVVVGETSRGAGRLSATYPLSETLILVVPENRSEHPVSGTGFEKVGVKPNINAKSEESLFAAHSAALKKLISINPVDSKLKAALVKVREEKQATDKRNSALNVKLKEYEGIYKDREILAKGGKLLYRKAGQPDFGMEKFEKDNYKLILPSGVRARGPLPSIRFERNENGEIMSISIVARDGNVRETFVKKW